MSGLILLRPWWGLALVPLALLAIWLWRRGTTGPWTALIAPALLVQLQDLGWLRAGRGSQARIWLPLAGALIVLGLCGPSLPRAGQAEYRRLDPLLLVLDLSPSVVASPVGLAALQTSAMRLLQSAGGRPVGIMGYAADAYLISAPTSDGLSLAGTLAVLGPDTMPVAGSRPDIALSMARDLFAAPENSDGPGIGGADIVLISDGGGIRERAVEQAARLQNDGARVWAVVLPVTAAGAPAPDSAALQSLARAGGGQAAPEADVPRLSAEISAGARVRLARDPQSGAALRDFGPFVLGLAMICLLPLYRRRRG